MGDTPPILQHALVGLSTSNDYLQAGGGAHYNVRSYMFCR